MAWIIRILLVISGGIASWFVARDALNFAIVQMVIAILLFTLIIAIVAFWPVIKNAISRMRNNNMKHHAPGFLALVNESKKHIQEITPDELKKKLAQDSIQLIDVREDHEWSTGKIPEAIHLSRGIIERDIEKTIPDRQQPIVVYCSGGFRCALVAESLQKMGYSQVYSLNTGLQGWIDAGYPVEKNS